MLDQLFNSIRKHLRPPSATPLFQVSPNGRDGMVLVQEAEHQYKIHSFAGPKGVRPAHSYDSLQDLVRDLLFRAKHEQLDPARCPVRCKAGLQGGTIEVVSTDRDQDYDSFDAKHPVSIEWASWLPLLGGQHSPGRLMELVRYLEDPRVLLLNDGAEEGSLIEKEIDFAVLVHRQLGALRIVNNLEGMTTTLKNGLVTAQAESRDKSTSATLPDEFFIVCPILDGGLMKKVRVVVSMEVTGTALGISLVVPDAQIKRLQIELSDELGRRVARELGEDWSVAVGAIGEREVYEVPNTGHLCKGRLLEVKIPDGFVESLRQAERDAPPSPAAPADGGPVDSTPS